MPAEPEYLVPPRSLVPRWLPAPIRGRLEGRENRLRQLLSRAVVPAGAPRTALGGSLPKVDVYIATLNTALATEVCIRSLRHNAGTPYRLIVGDGGSTDGSLEMLRALAERGWLELEVDPSRPQHHEWLDRWLAGADSRPVVFCDSDVEFLRPGVLRELVAMGFRTNAAMVSTERVCADRDDIEPVTGRAVRAAERLSAWLFLADPDQLRDLGTSFAFHFEETDLVSEGAIVYDTSALFLREARRRGLAVAAMPRRYALSYRHHRGLTWRPLLGIEEGRRERRIRTRLERRLVELRAEQDDGASP